MNELTEYEALGLLNAHMTKRIKIIEALEVDFKRSCKESTKISEEHASLVREIHRHGYIVDLFNYEVRKRGN